MIFWVKCWSFGEQFNYFIGTNTPKNYTNISVGPNGIAALSSTHIGMLSQLGSIKSISAVGDEQLIYNQELKKRISKGWVATLGQEGDLSVEMLLKSKSKTLVYSAFSGKLAIENKLKKQAKKKGLGEKRTDAYVYGTMRKTGWTPSTQKKGKKK